MTAVTPDTVRDLRPELENWLEAGRECDARLAVLLAQVRREQGLRVEANKAIARIVREAQGLNWSPQQYRALFEGIHPEVTAACAAASLVRD